MNTINSITDQEALHKQMLDARAVTSMLARSTTEQKNVVLFALAEQLREKLDEIIVANAIDVEQAQQAGFSVALIDRLRLDSSRIEAMAASLEKIARLPDPVGNVIVEWSEPNGLTIKRVRTPLGVIGVIYESRPNVTIDAAALCFKSGNPVILRGGRDAFSSNRFLGRLFQQVLEVNQMPKSCVQLVQSRDRNLVAQMLRAQGLIDVIVPRGGKALVARVMEEAKVPIFAHLEGIVHVYLHHSAEAEMAERLILNAKMRRTSICGAAECLLVDEKFDKAALKKICHALIAQGCTLHGESALKALDERVVLATDSDWGCEYLSADLAVKFVKDQQEAKAHIAQYSSGHTEVIISNDQAVAEDFLSSVDSAIVMHNASSQFADGGEFGMGAEIGISTGKMHARGPVGLEQLTSFHYQVRGNGAVRA